MDIVHISDQYRSIGVDEYYRNSGNDYQNPHAKFALQCLDALWNESFGSMLDFACGDGLVTKHLKNKSIQIYGCDKFLHERYAKETGCEAFSFSFEEVAQGNARLPMVDVVVFSYAIDIVNKTYLSNLLFHLAQISKSMIVIRPNNHVEDHYAWSINKSVKVEKSRGVLYNSNLAMELT